MKPGYEINHRGLTVFTRIIVYNWHYINQINMVRWDDKNDFIQTNNVVAIFKVKPKI